MPPSYLSHENRTLLHKITEVDVKLKSYIENELKQNKILKKCDQIVESNREPKTQ